MTGLGLLGGALLPVQGELFLESKATLFFAEIVLAYLLFVDAPSVEIALLDDLSSLLDLLLWLAFGFASIVLLSETYDFGGRRSSSLSWP